MKEEIILKVEDLSKQYRLGVVGAETIKEDLKRFWYRIRGKEDPFLMIGEANDRTTNATSDYVLALKNINFEVNKGEVLGIIGANGAGKSTLLKILSKITTPTEGSIKYKGRIASLLEIGTGFHGELTGRENIYLNGAVLGMSKEEISFKMEEIIEFSGCEGYIDTPVKRYSSGMGVRLGFAVAAFLEPDILIVDEVLAVGDAEFQKKAIGKMKDISRGEGGRTVLFVSHNMQSIKNLCTRAILLDKGEVKVEGNVDKVIGNYLSNENLDISTNALFNNEIENDVFNLHEINISNLGESMEKNLVEDKEIELLTDITIYKEPDRYHITYHLLDNYNESIISFGDRKRMAPMRLGRNKLKCLFPSHFFQPGRYSLLLFIVKDNRLPIFRKINVLNFIIIEEKKDFEVYKGREPGHIRPIFEWKNEA